ncbi:hypothetical protein GCM10009613_38830 [Pseudonocardia kongjuensis]|uniref:Transcriptional regulator, AbiEi antitoxin, Type IV TA system n=1 Tax=Pseudonocardia kongjuensis TaxID=102227 RepID=A0ABN1XY87_9PSEU
MDEAGRIIRLRRELRAAGWSDDELRRARRTGVLRQLRRGAYLDGALPADAVERHHATTRAVLAQLGEAAVASHVSAAVLHGLAVWNLPLDRVHVTRDRSYGGRRTRDLHLHPSPLGASDRTVVGGLAVTTCARTVVDIARTAGFEIAVALADSALARRERGVPPPLLRHELDMAVAAAAGRRGAGAVRRVAAFADGRSGSVGESRARVALAVAGLPEPELQFPIVVAGHRYLADFAWPRQRVIGEFDGRVKYGRRGKPDTDALYSEKLREDRTRSAGFAVHRWTWQDLADFRGPAARLRAALVP